MRKIISFILILLITLSTTSSCSLFKKDSADDDTDNASNTSEAVVTDDSESEHYDEVLDEDNDDGAVGSLDAGDEPLLERDLKGISFDQENDESVVSPVKSDVSKYYGSWTATSDRATFLYGNVDLTIRENGTWTGVITDEHINGKWTDREDRLQMKSEIFSFEVAFDKTGSLIMIEKNPDGEIDTVLTRK